MKLRVEGHPELIKDSETKAVVTNDSPAYLQRLRIRNEKQKAEQEKQQIQSEISGLKEQVHHLNSKMEQILTLLQRDSK